MFYEMKIITEASRKKANSEYIDGGYIVEYDKTLYFVDTEGEKLKPDERDWMKVESDYVFDEIENDDNYTYFINDKAYDASEILEEWIPVN